MNAKQFRDLIKLVLTKFAIRGFYSTAAVELLMLTAAQESKLGHYIRQIKGPALGVFQMEPETHADIWDNFLSFKPDLTTKVQLFKLVGGYKDLDLVANIPYQIAMARIFYWRFSEALPASDDVRGLAEYYKKYFNTHLGAATVEEAIENYERYA